MPAAKAKASCGSSDDDRSLVFPPREERCSSFPEGSQHSRALCDVRSLRPGEEGEGILQPGVGRGGRFGGAAVATGRSRLEGFLRFLAFSPSLFSPSRFFVLPPPPPKPL